MSRKEHDEGGASEGGNAPPALPDLTRIAHVHFRIRNLERVKSFYCGILGFREAIVDDATIAVSPTGRPPYLFMFTEAPDAALPPAKSTGLFHAAIRFPTRSRLASAVIRLGRRGYPIQGAADHGVSEAIYLTDEEGNGLELYRDRPVADWTWASGEIRMVTEPLDLEDLLQSAGGHHDDELDPETDIGHVHLKVSSLSSAETFYRDHLGFHVTTRSYPGALFLAAGNYHHHIGANIWASRHATPPPGNALGLVSFGINIPADGWNDLARRLSSSFVDRDVLRTSVDPGRIQIRDADRIGVELIRS